MLNVRFDDYCRDRVALFVAPWSPGGSTVGYVGADGQLYGCRDVSQSPNHDSIVRAWTDEAARNGLPVLHFNLPRKIDPNEPAAALAR